MPIFTDTKVLSRATDLSEYRKNRYEEACSYPINGTFKAVVKDFDMDGENDIATIVFFCGSGE